MKPFELDKFLLYVFSPLLLGTIVGFLFKDYYSVLEQFNRNIIIPPIAFIIVWSVLYLLMGIWYYIYDFYISYLVDIYKINLGIEN